MNSLFISTSELLGALKVLDEHPNKSEEYYKTYFIIEFGITSVRADALLAIAYKHVAAQNDYVIIG